MEIANQGSLSGFIEEQTSLFADLAESIVLKTKLLRDSFLALKFLHSQNIMHRDFKPDNILITKIENDYSAKLCDFGISKKAEFTCTRTMGEGTPLFLAPEA